LKTCSDSPTFLIYFNQISFKYFFLTEIFTNGQFHYKHRKTCLGRSMIMENLNRKLYCICYNSFHFLQKSLQLKHSTLVNESKFILKLKSTVNQSSTFFPGDMILICRFESLDNSDHDDMYFHIRKFVDYK